MSNGGKRQGAGRPKGAVAKVTAQARKKALESGISPLDYMLKVMRNSNADPKRRDDMAKAAAPFVHAKLASVQHGGAIGTYDLSKLTDAELDILEPILARLTDGTSGAVGEGEEEGGEAAD